MADRHRVVVVGGGFGGLNAVRGLDGVDVDVTLVDRTNHHLFQPLLYQVATGILPPGLIAPALRSIIKQRGQRARAAGRGQRHRPASSKVVHAHGPDGRPLDLPYDTLVVAAGATHSYFGKDQFAEFATGMKTIEDARYLRDGILSKFEMAEIADRPEGTRRLADLRRDRRRPDRCRARRPDRRAGAHGAAAGLPLGQHPARRGSSCWKGAPSVLPPFAPEAAALHPADAGEDGCRGPAQLPRRRHGPRQHHGQGPGRRRDHPDPHPDLGGGRAGLTAGEDARREGGRRDRPRRTGPGQPRLHRSRAPGGLRHRRHGVAEQAARRRAARHAGGQVRRQASSTPGSRATRRRRRSSTSTRAPWRPSATGPPSPTRSA